MKDSWSKVMMLGLALAAANSPAGKDQRLGEMDEEYLGWDLR